MHVKNFFNGLLSRPMFSRGTRVMRGRGQSFAIAVQSARMINAELARVFERIADLMEISGEDGFRIASYRKAARSLEEATEDVVILATENRLGELPGIGKSTIERINQYLKTGKIDVLTELEAKFPPGVPALLAIPSLGPKKVALVHSKLGVNNMEDLKKVIASGALAELPGFGATSVRKIADGIAFLETSGGRTPLGEAMPIAELLIERVRRCKGVKRVEPAGSLRRGQETIGDLDILCDADDGASVIGEFVKFPEVKRILASGDTKGSVTVALDGERELQVDLRAVPAGSFGAAWQYFTGSKEHNVKLRELAGKHGWKLNEYGLFDGERMIAGKTEESIYRKLGLKCPPPELRQNRDEFAEAAGYDDLVTLDDIRGDLHMHTVASDGRNSIEEMALAARARGYQYIAICDHSKSSVIANGLSVVRMEKHIAEIRKVAKTFDDISILVGCECDILPNGDMDYPDDILEQCDWVVASIHSAQGTGGGGKLGPTERTLAAIENRWVCAVGHPTGRLINKRPAMDLDIATIAKAAAGNHTMLEINASWQRLDLKDVHARQALAAGVMLTINTDSHHVDQLAQMRLGVITARRAAARRKDIANTLTPAALRKRIAAKRR
jgi:DNA polymerase (family 10)